MQVRNKVASVPAGVSIDLNEKEADLLFSMFAHFIQHRMHTFDSEHWGFMVDMYNRLATDETGTTKRPLKDYEGADYPELAAVVIDNRVYKPAGNFKRVHYDTNRAHIFHQKCLPVFVPADAQPDAIMPREEQ